ncbi:unnamed protein product, partial [Prunus brigantina]
TRSHTNQQQSLFQLQTLNWSKIHVSGPKAATKSWRLRWIAILVLKTQRKPKKKVRSTTPYRSHPNDIKTHSRTTKVTKDLQ